MIFFFPGHLEACATGIYIWFILWLDVSVTYNNFGLYMWNITITLFFYLEDDTEIDIDVAVPMFKVYMLLCWLTECVRLTMIYDKGCGIGLAPCDSILFNVVWLKQTSWPGCVLNDVMYLCYEKCSHQIWLLTK